MRAQIVTGALALTLALGPTGLGGPRGAAVKADTGSRAAEGRVGAPDKPGHPPPGTPATWIPADVVLGESTPEHGVLKALREGDHRAARTLAEAALTPQPKTGAVHGRLLWLHAKACEGLDAPEAAELDYAALMDLGHPLSPWARLALGTLQARHDAERAVTTLSPLLNAPFGDRGRATELHAIALARTSRHAEAAPILRALVAQTPSHLAAATVAMPLAELLDARGDDGGRLEALSLYRRVHTRAPGTPVGKLARRRAEALLKRLPAALRAAHKEPDVEDAFALGAALGRERRYDDAIATLEQLERRVKDDLPLLCKARLERGRALLRKRARQEGAALMTELTETCSDPEVTAWARYYAGRALLRLNRPADALSHYDALPKEAPGHRLADDGLFRGALAAADANDEAGMLSRLKRLVAEHPDGDMRPDGLFLLAWRARKQGRHAEALTYLDTLLQDGAGEHEEGIEGRAAYWRARALSALKRQGPALAAYEAVARRYPLTYYAQQALAQLQSQAPKRAKRVLSYWSADARGSTEPAQRPASTDPGLAGAVALLQVGEAERAERALRGLGMLGKQADEERLWLAAALYDATGAYAKASALSRHRLRGFMEQPPAGAARQKWRIAYPNAFCPLIEQAAKEAGVPATFVRAVAREESAFNPRAVSPARAYGLIQLMRPTAREHAKRLGLPSHPAALKRPEVNLRIGAQFIRFLWSRYKKNPAVVPAAYNAGHGAAERWMRARPHMPLDEWVENIPYGETRRYTRRVLQTYGIYQFLETGKLPRLAKKLPI